MSYRVISQTKDGHRELVADTEADLPDILKAYEPVSMGTMVYIISTSQLFVLDGNQKWVEAE